MPSRCDAVRHPEAFACALSDGTVTATIHQGTVRSGVQYSAVCSQIPSAFSIHYLKAKQMSNIAGRRRASPFIRGRPPGIRIIRFQQLTCLQSLSTVWVSPHGFWRCMQCPGLPVSEPQHTAALFDRLTMVGPNLTNTPNRPKVGPELGKLAGACRFLSCR